MERCRPYSQKISHLINDMLVEVEKTNFGLMEKRNIKTTLYVVITSDRGMAGAFNTNIIKTAQNQIDLDQSNKSKIICIGKKSRDYFKNKNYEVISEYLDFWADLNFKNAINIGNQISDLFLNKDVDCVKVFYNEFKNLGSQTIKNVKFLPLEENVDTKKTKIIDRLFEPNKEQILEDLIPKYINVQVWQYLLESFASEQAARMVAMENATENAGEMIKELGLQYNKARQTAITTEIIEIVSGANALSS